MGVLYYTRTQRIGIWFIRLQHWKQWAICIQYLYSSETCIRCVSHPMVWWIQTKALYEPCALCCSGQQQSTLDQSLHLARLYIATSFAWYKHLVFLSSIRHANRRQFRRHGAPLTSKSNTLAYHGKNVFNCCGCTIVAVFSFFLCLH